MTAARIQRTAAAAEPSIIRVVRTLEQMLHRMLIKNAHSTKMGKKDIIKIDSLIDLDINVLGYVSPDATVDIIRDGVLCEKKKMSLLSLVLILIICLLLLSFIIFTAYNIFNTSESLWDEYL